ncbi:hypothetical protein [Sorangium sp. So ce1151]|uniref:hypothetical protein n=1 Tax=Sorangium sp. So ce1151 TaxID=3133332 RepID=UPI003F5E3317
MDTSTSLFFGLMMFQTFGAGCTARVEVGDDSGSGGQEAGPDGAAGEVESSASSGVAGGGGFSSTSGSAVAVGAGGFSSTSGSSGAGGADESTSGSSVAVGAGGFSSTSGSSGAGGGDAAPAASAIALFRSQLPSLPSDDSDTSSSAGGGPDLDPNDLFIILRAPAPSCEDPYAFVDCNEWKLTFTIPPALQVPGILDLSAPDLNPSVIESGPNEDGSCWWGGGSFFGGGTMEIVSIDAAEVVIRVSGTDTHSFDANGEYTAARCR